MNDLIESDWRKI